MEILVVVAAIGVMAGAGFYTTSSIQTSARQSKLQSDVASLNHSIVLYEVNGGTIQAGAAAEDVLIKLKTRSNATLGIGMNQNFVDVRVTPVFQSASEAGSGDMRAVWDPAGQQFYTTFSGSGIREFTLDDTTGAGAPQTETRSQAMQPTTTLNQPSWIWQYTNVVAANLVAGAQPGVVGEATNAAAARSQLSAPLFSLGSGTFPLTDFNKSVTLSNPNNAAVSAVYYSLNGAPLQLYAGSAVSVPPNQTLSAYAMSLDIQDWLDSGTVQNTYTMQPYQLTVSLSGLPSTLTYQAAGGSMLTGTTSTPGATASTSDLSPVPSSLQSNSYFEVMYDYGAGGNPLTDSAATAGSYSSASISLAIGRWGTASSLVVSAAVKAINTQYFISSTVATGTVGISKTTLAAPIFSAGSAYSTQITISPSSGYPANYQIYYTPNGTDPGAGTTGSPTSSSAVLYSSAFTPTFGTGASNTYVARAYGPSSYTQWFTPSGTTSVTVYNYVPSGLASGALVGAATINGTFVGSLIYSSGSSFAFNSSANVLNGNVYLPGTPTFQFNGSESAIIKGNQYTANGVLITPQTDTNLIESLNGPTTPTGYTVTFNSGAVIQGKVYTQTPVPTMPTVAAPPSPSNGSSTTLNSGTVTVNPATTSGVTINSGTATLQAGAYGSVTINNGTIVLGTAGATTPTVYSFQSLTLNSGSLLQVVGPVIVTMGGSLTVNSTMGNSAHPSWLELNMYSGQFTVNSGGAVYGEIVDPNNSITLNGTFNGSIIAKTLTVNGSGVAFTLPPPSS